METNRKSIILFVTTGLLVLTSTIIFKIVDIVEGKKTIFLDNDLFQVGAVFCFFSFPILAFILFFYTRLSNSDINQYPGIKIVVTSTILLWIFNLLGILLFFAPLRINIIGYDIPMWIVSISGFIGGLVAFVGFSRWLSHQNA